MTYILIVLLLYKLCLIDSPEDLGACIRYQVEITTSENNTEEGIFQHATFNPVFKFSGTEFKEFLDSVAYHDTVTLYKEIYPLAYPKDYYKGLNCIPNLYAIAQEDIIEIPSSKISEAVLKSYEPCDNCTSNNEQAGFAFNGMSTIKELTKKEILLLQQKPTASYQFWYPDSENQPYFGYGSYQILSYNEAIELEALKEIGGQLIQADIEDVRQDNSYADRQKRYRELKEDLRQKDIVLFTIHEAP